MANVANIVTMVDLLFFNSPLSASNPRIASAVSFRFWPSQARTALIELCSSHDAVDESLGINC
jgi:hypothetical protein